MNIEPVAEEYASWSTTVRSYRVYFWTLLQEAASPRSAPLWRSDTYRLVEVQDVGEVLEWARQDSEGRQFTVYAETQESPPGLLQIFGTDPTMLPPLS